MVNRDPVVSRIASFWGTPAQRAHSLAGARLTSSPITARDATPKWKDSTHGSPCRIRPYFNHCIRAMRARMKIDGLAEELAPVRSTG